MASRKSTPTTPEKAEWKAYQLDAAIESIVLASESAGGEVTEEDIAAICAVDMQKKDLAIQCAKAMKNEDFVANMYRAQESALKNEAKALSLYASVREARSRKFEQLAIKLLEECGEDRIQTEMGVMRSQLNGQSKVEWIGQGEIPEEVRIEKVKVEVTYDRDAVIGAFEQGIVLDGFQVTRGKTLRFSS